MVRSIFFLSLVALVNVLTPVNCAANEREQPYTGICFEENKGQFRGSSNEPLPHVLFKAALPGADIYITETGASYVFLELEAKSKKRKERHDEGKKSREIKWSRADLVLSGARITRSQVTGREAIDGVVNYYTPEYPNGLLGIQRLTSFIVKNVYPGIDWVWTVDAVKGLKYDFVVHPKANPDNIRLLYKWADVTLNESHDVLSVYTPHGTMSEGALKTFCNGVLVPSKYVLDPASGSVRFQVAAYDSTKALIIDPPLQLLWGTFIGSNLSEEPRSVKIDSHGNIVASGESSSITMPTVDPGNGAYFQGTTAGTWDIVIYKFNAAGQALWMTYYGGSGADACYSMTIDQNDNSFHVGLTQSFNLPLQSMPGAYFDNALNAQDGFILSFDSAGHRTWCTYYGGGNLETIGCVNVGLNNRLFITGVTKSADLPIVDPGNGAYVDSVRDALPGQTGWEDVFVAEFDDSRQLVWSTYYGGDENDFGNNIVQAPDGRIAVVGTTLSDISLEFPLHDNGGSYNVHNGGFHSSFLLEFNSDRQRVWCTHTASDYTTGVSAVYNSRNELYILNIYNSHYAPSVNTLLLNPGMGAYFQNTVCFDELYLLRFDSLRNLKWSTLIGGCDEESVSYGLNEPFGHTLAVDSADMLYLVAQGGENIATHNPGNGAFYHEATDLDNYIAVFNPLNQFVWATNFGTGADNDFSSGIALNDAGEIFTVGRWQGGSYSVYNPGNGAYWDTTTNGFQQDDGFIVKFGELPQTLHLDYIAVSNDSCNIPCAYSAKTLTSFGQAPFSFLWSNGQSTNPATGLCTGTYAVTVTDATGFSLVDSVVVTPAATPLTASVTYYPLQCHGDTATVKIKGMGGTAPYAGTGIYSIGEGVYPYTVTDAHGCQVSDTLVLTQPPPLVFDAVPADPVVCFGGYTTVTYVASGGEAPYSYFGSQFSVVPGQEYVYTVTDANNCKATDTVSISASPEVLVTVELDSIECHGDITTFTVSATSGLAPFNGTGIFSVIGGGSFNYDVSDANGCHAQGTISIPQPTEINPTVNYDPLLCFDDTTLVSVVASGGTPPYTGTGTYSATAGNFSQLITDANGCTALATAAIPAPSYILSIEAASDSVCAGDTLVLSVSSNQSDSVITWLPFGTTSINVTIVADTTMSVSVLGMSYDGCAASDTFEIQVQECISGTHVFSRDACRILPNPTNGILAITCDTGPVALRITDVWGRELSPATVSQNDYTTLLNFASFANGVYFVYIYRDRAASAHKIILDK